MEFIDILAISGKPGLYKLLGQSKGGVVVASLTDQKRFSLSNTSNLSALDTIRVYTTDDEIPLKDLLKTIHTKESGNETISHKETPEKLNVYFKEVLPNYDTDRVYLSHIKKIIQWYNILVFSKFDFSTLV